MGIRETKYALSDDDSIEEATTKLVEAYELAEIAGDDQALRNISNEAYLLLNYDIVNEGPARKLNRIASDNPEITGLLMELIHSFCKKGREVEHYVRVDWACLKRAVEGLMARGAS